MPVTPEKMERIVMRLQRRIAEITAQYELDRVVMEDEIEELKGALGDSKEEKIPEF